MDNSILKVQKLQKYYGCTGNITKAIDNISFEVKSGEFVGIMGASGSGKTTLLNCISTIDTVTAGHILLNGTDITEMQGKMLSKFRREKLGFVFQNFNLLDTLTGYENIALPLTINKTPANQIDEKVTNVARLLGVSDVLSKFPYQMSGGQQQRVGTARAIVTNPALLLADEPTGSLDSKSAGMLLESFLRLNTEINATILMVTHDAFSASYCKRILFVKDGKQWNELVRGNHSRKEFYDRILELLGVLGGVLDAE